MNSSAKIRPILLFFVTLAFVNGSILPFAPPAAAADVSPIRDVSGFQSYALPANDDGSTGAVPIGFTVNFFGREHDTLFVNNNGNITFDAQQYTYTPYDLTSTTREIIAAFFGDVDTRGLGSSLVTYGNDTVSGRQAFGVNYINVGYFNSHTDKLNSFQLILIDRSDIGPGDFDIEFNYEKIQWETGDWSGGIGGLGGSSARVGFSNGTRNPGTFFELPGSAINSAFLDTNPVSGLIYNSYNSGFTGRYIFQARNGVIDTSHNPLIFVPGMAGSKLVNDADQNDTYEEVWPNSDFLSLNPFDGFLRALKLNPEGTGPFDANDTAYSTVRVGDVITRELLVHDVYDSTIKYFTETLSYELNNDFFVCPYDWRKHIPDIASGGLANTLDKCINNALAQNPGKTRVDILAHSMGGLVARNYISDAGRADKVAHLVTLGTPYLGAPKIALGVLDNMCFMDFVFGTCFVTQATLHEIVQNFPSAYEVAPGEDYFRIYQGYIYRDSEKRFLDLDESYSLLREHNEVLADQAKAYNRSATNAVGGWVNGGTHGVKVLMIVGSGRATPQYLLQKQESSWWNRTGTSRTVYAMVEALNGDGTVPLHSANMRNPNPGGANLSNNVSTVYLNREHGELARDANALQVAASFFTSDQNFTSLSRDERRALAQHAAQPADGPRLEPFPLEGKFLTFSGDVIVEVMDPFGNRIGMLDEGGAYEVNIPGASFYPLESAFSFFLPNDRTYQILVDGQALTEVLIRIQNYVNDQMEGSTVYEPKLMTESSSAWLYFDPNAPPGNFALDQDGDGTVDDEVAVSAMLDGQQSTDLFSPETNIIIEGSPSSYGWYDGIVTVTITAEDNPGGVGIARVEYSFDLGQTIQEYTGPFNMDAGVHPHILARAVDWAGNSSWQSVMASASFEDVFIDYWSWSFIERLYAAGITGGCGTSPLIYCPEDVVTRAQMAVFLERGINGPSYTPPGVGGSTGFADVPTNHWAAAWIKQFALDGITAGCGANTFCPEGPVTRAQMAVFLLKAKYGVDYTPPSVGVGTGFADVPNEYWSAAWIKQLAAEGITGGCGGGNYCPEEPVTRAQMAVFLVKTFNLP